MFSHELAKFLKNSIFEKDDQAAAFDNSNFQLSFVFY